MFVTVRLYDAAGAILHEVNPYDVAEGTLRGLDPAYAPSSPPLGPAETHDDALVFEMMPSSTLTGESHTLHFVLADGRYKDNRIPPRGFRILEASARQIEPVWAGVPAPDYFSAAEYAGGYDQISLSLPAGAARVEVLLYYQTTSREYVEFLRDEINGTRPTLASPTPSGEAEAYVALTDPFFSGLRAWGDTIWDLWWHNKDVPGASPILMASAVATIATDPCALLGSEGLSCEDGNPCTSGDACAAGACAPGAPLACALLDECHALGVCQPSTGACTNPPQADGTPCSAGICASGICVAAMIDAGLVDAGLVDAGLVDTGLPDAASDAALADAAGDGSTAEAGLSDGGPQPAPEGGCGCRVMGSGHSRDAGPLGLLVALGALLRRRRRGRPGARAS